MKKLLSILSVVTLTSVTATTVVSCSVKTNKIDVEFSSVNLNGTYNIKDVTYDKHELASAMENGLGTSGIFSFNELNSKLFNVVAFDKDLITKTQDNNKQLRDVRNTFLGRDSKVTSDGLYTQSVDGVRISDEDVNEFYKGFHETSINSINGLADLAKASEENELAQVGNTDMGSVDTFKEEANKEFLNDFSGSSKNSSFKKVSYNVDLIEYNTKSMKFNFNKKDGELEQESEYKEYKKNNYLEDIENDGTKKINERKSDPFGQIILATEESLDFEGQKTTLILDKEEIDKDKVNTNVENFANNFDSVEYRVNNKDEDKKELALNFNKMILKDVKPFEAKYTFDSDTKSNNSNKYEISFKINNLKEVFSPIFREVEEKDKDNDSDIMQYQLIWVFRGYKFVDITNVTDFTETKVNKDNHDYLDRLNLETTHGLRDLNTSEWNIAKIEK